MRGVPAGVGVALSHLRRIEREVGDQRLGEALDRELGGAVGRVGETGPARGVLISGDRGPRRSGVGLGSFVGPEDALTVDAIVANESYVLPHAAADRKHLSKLGA